MGTETPFNDKLHRAIDQAVHDGRAKVADPQDSPASRSLIQLFVDNVQAGRPMLEGMKLYRGSKDPDVDAGTFDASFKHTTPLFSLARGYAETINGDIGLVSKGTRGVGMLAEYELPAGARFFRNFAAESRSASQSGSAPAAEALTPADVTRQLRPAVDAYMAARNEAELAAATDSLQALARAYLYEVPVPTEQKPLRQWVVQYDDTGSRLLEHQDRGPLADAMIDVVRARKASVDEHTAGKVAAYLGRGGTAGLGDLEAFSPGLGAATARTSEMIDAVLSELRAQSFSARLESLSEAIAWRTDAQKSIRMERLTNTGTSIEHDDPLLQRIATLQRSLEEVEWASASESVRRRKEAVLALLKRGEEATATRLQYLSQFEEAAAHEANASSEIDRCKDARSQAVKHLDDLEQLHTAKLSAGRFSRAFYRFGDQRRVQDEMKSQRGIIEGWDQRMASASGKWREARTALVKQREAVGAVSERLETFEQQLHEFMRAGDLAFLPDDVLETSLRPHAENWSQLALAASQKLEESDAWVARGRRSAALFKAIAAHGLDHGWGEQTRNAERESGEPPDPVADVDFGTPPFLLVRVQDALHGAAVGEKGLYLPYVRTDAFGTMRNTSHWSVNSIVADHAYGRFNEGPDGTLKGRVVIIADPREMPAPAGLGQVDTWFRMDAERAADGSLRRGIHVGPGAIIVAPPDVAVPEGVSVVRYEGGKAERDTAVSDVIRSRSLEVEQPTMWGWAGKGNSSDWAAGIARQYYPESAALIHLGAHGNSPDEAIESGSRTEALLEQFGADRLYTRTDGVQVPMYEVITDQLASQRTALAEMLESLPAPEKDRVGAFYQAQMNRLEAQHERARSIERSWTSAAPPPLLDQQSVTNAAPVATLPELPPHNTLAPPPLLPGANMSTFEQASQSILGRFAGTLSTVDVGGALALPAAIRAAAIWSGFGSEVDAVTEILQKAGLGELATEGITPSSLQHTVNSLLQQGLSETLPVFGASGMASALALTGGAPLLAGASAVLSGGFPNLTGIVNDAALRMAIEGNGRSVHEYDTHGTGEDEQYAYEAPMDAPRG